MSISSFLSEKFAAARGNPKTEVSIYDFTINAIDGTPVDFSQYQGKKLLIVNTASKCGFTPQYADLQKLHEQYGDKVVVLGFPANNFLWQEPADNNAIAAFCEKNYGVTFQLFEKINVKGKERHELYKWLEAKTGKLPSWNFCKYLVNEDGTDVKFFPSKKNPLDQEIIDLIIGS
ncbi:MAG TPA: glutathione peroxidase [Cyclobacteriaceae bacterium]|nr:glutathione peroxidase [Cyclobacteriaceae bacterium]